jgi:hypothetical protein
MFQPGIYSMQDFHFFRLYEFDKCVQSFQIPCRWAPDAGLGYGEPLFNFYGQFSYAVGEVFHLIGFSFIDSLKILFALSILASGIGMYFLVKNLWRNEWGAVIAAIVYIYAPYRAVDVWVRGALPEALSFVLFPFIILSIEKRKFVSFGILFALLILTHNLSALMFLPFVLTWLIYRKFWKGFWGFGIAGVLTAFYILPVVFEAKFINLVATTQGYFDFRAHFLTVKQIFYSFYWGYGGSTWGDGDGLNLSVGLIQWILPTVIVLILILKKKLSKHREFLVLLGLGIFYLVLTHNKSTFIWEALPFMKFIQFPWRFLGVAVFCFSLSAGLITRQLPKKYAIWTFVGIATLLLVINFRFFREDIWFNVGDSYFTTGEEWNRQRAASIGDFWPDFGHKIPDRSSDGKYINYFPGWNKPPDENGLILAEGAKFSNTPVRSAGNIISLVGLCISILFLFLL